MAAAADSALRLCPRIDTETQATLEQQAALSAPERLWQQSPSYRMAAFARSLICLFAGLPRAALALPLPAAACRKAIRIVMALTGRVHTVPKLRKGWSEALHLACRLLPVLLSQQPQPETAQLGAALLTGFDHAAAAMETAENLAAGAAGAPAAHTGLQRAARTCRCRQRSRRPQRPHGQRCHASIMS